MKTTLTFPDPSKAAHGGFLFEIDGNRYEIEKFTDIIGSLGVSRRARAAGLDMDPNEDFGEKAMIALVIALKDDAKAVQRLDHLDAQQGIDLLTKWGEFTGADLPES